MRRAALPFVLSLAVGLSVVSVASADPPSRTFVPATPFSDRLCPGFDVLVTPVVDNEYALTFSNGSTIITGRLVVKLTNLSTGKTIQVNVSGPSFISEDGSTLTLRGLSGIFVTAGQLGPGAPPASQVLSGVAVIDLTTGMVVSETGHIRDLCAELSG